MLLLLATAYAELPPPPATIVLDGRGVLMDETSRPINHAKPYLIANPSSRKPARRAKTMSTLGTLGLFAGAGAVVLSASALAIASDADKPTPTGAYGTMGLGFAVLGVGCSFKIVSHKAWKKTVPLYDGSKNRSPR